MYLGSKNQEKTNQYEWGQASWIHVLCRISSGTSEATTLSEINMGIFNPVFLQKATVQQSIVTTKGQIISKGLCGILVFFQKTIEQIRF